jgi:hypothetical protein
LVLAGGGAILGGVLPAALGLGKNKYQPGNFGQSPQYNPNAANLGIDYRQYGTQGQAAGQRGFVQAQTGNVDNARVLGGQARTDQGQALDLLRMRATGQVPSIAAMQGRASMEQALANQQSAVASTRGGPGAQALAARSAMLANATTRGNIASQTAIAAANERLAAENAYFGGTGAVRSQDQSQQGLEQQFALGQGQLALGSQGQNDSLQLGLYGLQNQAAIAEAQGRIAQQGQLAGSYNNQQGLAAGIAGNNAQQDWKYWQGGLGGAQGGLQAAGALGLGNTPPQGSLGAAPGMPSGANGYQFGGPGYGPANGMPGDPNYGLGGYGGGGR